MAIKTDACRMITKKINCGINESKDKLQDVFQLVNQLKSLGPVAVFGGTLRDWSICGPSRLPRDVDLVIDCADVGALQKTLDAYAPRKNNFDGYRLAIGNWQVDLWAITSTWAFRFGHVSGNRFDDLPKTTFLNIDGIAYDLQSKRLYCSYAYEKFVKDRVLDINLEANPNPLGCILRSLRLASLYEFALSPKLSRYIAQNAVKYTPDDLGATAHGIFHHPVDGALLQQTIKDVCKHVDEFPVLPMPLEKLNWRHSLFSSL
jgi:hypothetical protein